MEWNARRQARWVGAAALVGAMVLPALPAAAQYGPPEEPTLEVSVLQPLCDGDVPYLEYAVNVINGSGETATITWEHPTDPSQNHVQAGVPLSGRVMWPGAAVDDQGNPSDWPGWRLENGEWVEGDEWDWGRPEVRVTISVNPQATVTVAYPPSSPACLTNPPNVGTATFGPPPGPGTTESSGVGMAVTGAGVGWLVTAGAALLVAGAALIFLRRRVARD